MFSLPFPRACLCLEDAENDTGKMPVLSTGSSFVPYSLVAQDSQVSLRRNLVES